MNTLLTPQGKKGNNFLHVFGILLCIAACAGSLRVIYLHPMASDSWLHLATGRFVLEQKRIPTHIDISVKKVEPVLEWVAQSWLADIFLYLSTRANLSINTNILLTFFLLLSLLIATDIGRLLRVHHGVLVSGIFIGALAALPFWKLHPYIILPALTLAMIQGYLRWRQNRSIPQLFFIPIIFYLWANIAGGLLFIPLYLLIGMCVTEWATHLHTPLKKSYVPLTIMGVCAVFLTLLTPNWIRIWIYNVTVYGLLDSRKWYSTLAGALDAANTSNIKFAPSSFMFIVALIYIFYVVFSVAYLLSAHYKRTIQSISAVLFTLPMLILPLIWIRFIPLAILSTLPLFFMVSTLLLDTILPDVQKQKFFHILTLIAGTIMMCMLWIWPPTLFPYVPPKEQLDVIVNHALSKQIMVSTDIAGYAYYRLYPTRGFIDAQDDLYDEHDAIAIFSGYSGVSEASIKELTNAYDFSTVLVSKENDYLTGYFSTHPDWIMTYLAYNGIVFVKRESAPDSFIARYGLPSLDLSVDMGVKKDAIHSAITELERFTKNAPESTLAIGQLATLYRAGNQLEKAEDTLMRIPGDQWDYVVMTEMGRIKAAQGLCKQSETWFLRALNERDEKNVSKTTFDLAILYAVCFNDEEKAKHYFKRYTSYPIPGFERERATEIMKKYVRTLEE